MCALSELVDGVHLHRRIEQLARDDAIALTRRALADCTRTSVPWGAGITWTPGPDGLLVTARSGHGGVVLWEEIVDHVFRPTATHRQPALFGAADYHDPTAAAAKVNSRHPVLPGRAIELGDWKRGWR